MNVNLSHLPLSLRWRVGDGVAHPAAALLALSLLALSPFKGSLTGHGKTRAGTLVVRLSLQQLCPSAQVPQPDS